MRKRRKIISALDKTVYNLFRTQIEGEGYAPNNSEAARRLGISPKTVRTSIVRLANYHFISYQIRRWSSVKLDRRYCRQCAEEIVPQNAACLLDRRSGVVRIVVSGLCADCRRLNRNEIEHAWNERNPGYRARRMKRMRAKNAKTHRSDAVRKQLA